MKLPSIKGAATEEHVGKLFEAWWNAEGLESFIEYLEDMGQPVIDDREDGAILKAEDMLMNTRDAHDKFLEGVEDIG